MLLSCANMLIVRDQWTTIASSAYLFIKIFFSFFFFLLSLLLSLSLSLSSSSLLLLLVFHYLKAIAQPNLSTELNRPLRRKAADMAS